MRSAAALLPLAALLAVACGEDPAAPPPGTELHFDIGPVDLLAGGEFGVAIEVAVLDADGLVMKGAAGEVELRLEGDGAGGGLTGATWAGLDDGIARFPMVGVAAAGGGLRLEAEWNGLRVTSEEFHAVSRPDLVTVAGAEGLFLGLLVDGTSRGAFQNDQLFTGSSGVFTVGVLRGSPWSEEITLFGDGMAPSVTAGQWTPAEDSAVVVPRSPVVVPLTVWVISGPFEERSALIEEDVRLASELFTTERSGLVLDAAIMDVTEHPRAPELLDVDGNVDELGLEAVGYEPGRLNMYAVRSIAGGGDDRVIAGQAIIGGDMSMVVDLAWGHMILAHEIGHNLGLRHINGSAGFDRTNLMWQGSGSDRAFLTEGQSFRMHYDRWTVLNSYFGLLPTAVQRACQSGFEFEGSRCLPESLRIYPDDPTPASSKYHAEKSGPALVCLTVEDTGTSG